LLPNPDSLAPAAHAQVLIYPPAGAGNPMPTPPPGFHFFMEHQLNSAIYPVFVRPGTSATTRP
jgi:hypothetical protein